MTVRPGLSFRETLRGSYFLLEDPMRERALDLDLEARASDLRRLPVGRTFSLQGTIDAEGLGVGRPASGTLGVHLFDERRLPYRLHFTGDDGARYELSGQKEWVPFAPLESVTTLRASLYDEAEREVGRALLRFDARREGLRFLGSFRLRLLG